MKTKTVTPRKPAPKRKADNFERWIPETRPFSQHGINNGAVTVYVVGTGTYEHDCGLARMLATLLNRHRVTLTRGR